MLSNECQGARTIFGTLLSTDTSYSDRWGFGTDPDPRTVQLDYGSGADPAYSKKFFLEVFCLLIRVGTYRLTVGTLTSVSRCSGSVIFGPPGSGSGSVRRRYGSSSRSAPSHHQAKQQEKRFIYVLGLLYDFISLKKGKGVKMLVFWRSLTKRAESGTGSVS